MSKLFARRSKCGEMNICGEAGCLKKCAHSFFRIRPAARSTREKKKELSCDQRHYTHIYNYIYIYNVYGRNTTPSFSLLWSVPRAGFEKKNEYIFLRHPAPAGRICFINLNQAASRTKFCHGPDLARGPDFGHACSKTFLMRCWFEFVIAL